MKKAFKVITTISLCFLLMISFISCEKKGVAYEKLNGNEENLPIELKGLKVYRVSIGSGDYIKVALLDNKVNSTTYSQGKTNNSVILLNKQNNKVIEVSQVLYENDSLLIVKK